MCLVNVFSIEIELFHHVMALPINPQMWGHAQLIWFFFQSTIGATLGDFHTNYIISEKYWNFQQFFFSWNPIFVKGKNIYLKMFTYILFSTWNVQN